MNFEELYKQLIKDFHLESLPEEDREEMLTEIAKTVQKQFLMDVYDTLGEKNFDALQASAKMGEEFYHTTLKHLLPACDEVFRSSLQKVVVKFNTQ